MIQSAPRWLPFSWLFVGFSLSNLWRRLNLGDRLFLIGIVFGGLAISLGFGLKLTHYLASSFPHWLPLGTAAFACVLVVLSFNLPMITVRSHRFNSFVPESSARLLWRISLEAGVASIACVIVIAILIGQLPALQRQSAMIEALTLAIGAQAFWHLIQYYFGATKFFGAKPAVFRATSSRRTSGAAILTHNAARYIPATSSRFLLKAITNAFIWIVLALSVLTAGGALASSPDPLLWTLLLLSSGLLLVQIALMEPRIGNGVVLGMHSIRTPIKRGLSDLIALSIPHFGLLSLAAGTLAVHGNWIGLAGVLGLYIVIIWGLWLWLVTGALPPRTTAKYGLSATVGGIIIAQFFPPLVIIIAIAITVALTRDLISLNTKEPALWPRP
jgi:hypothetical protein